LALARLRTIRLIALWAGILLLLNAIAAFLASWNWDNIGVLAIAHFGAIAGPLSPQGFLQWLFYFSPYPRLIEFLFGCFAASLFMAMRAMPISAREAALGGIALRVSIFLMIAAFAWLFRPDQHRVPIEQVFEVAFALGPPLAVLLFCCARYDTFASRFLSRPRLVLCGEASYSIYMVHMGLIQYVAMVAKYAGNIYPIYSFWSVLNAAASLVVVPMTAIGLALVTYIVIEVPARRWLRRWLTLRSSAAPPR